uniref:Uncharacterized protein n=1 Tax=Ficedula albicollis TaxID=59894 RepID=A0A803VIW3_FICAL
MHNWHCILFIRAWSGRKRGTILKPPIKCLFCIWDPSVLTHNRNETLLPPVNPDLCLCLPSAQLELHPFLWSPAGMGQALQLF